MKKLLIGILTSTALMTAAHAGNDPYSVGAIFDEPPIKADKNLDKLPANNAVWKKYGIDYINNNSPIYVDTKSKKLVDAKRQIYTVDTKTTIGSDYTLYKRQLIGCGQVNYISAANGVINKKLDKRGSLMSYQTFGVNDSLRNINVFNPSNTTSVALKQAACK